MPKIEFEENFNNLNKPILSDRKTTQGVSGGLSSWLIKRGIAKDTKSAKNIMIVIIFFCFAVVTIIVSDQAGLNIFNSSKQKEDSFIKKIEQTADFQKLSPQEQSGELNQIRQYYGN